MVSFPEPSLVRVPPVLVLMPVVLMTVSPVPPMVRALPVPVMPPVRVRAVAAVSELMRTPEEPRVMAPA